MSSTPKKEDVQNEVSVEENLNRLETIVERLESDETLLEEAIDLYEEGMKIAAQCRTKLDAARLRIEHLGEQDDSNEQPEE